MSANWKLFAFLQTAPGPSTSTGLVPLLASPTIANRLIATVDKLTPPSIFSINKRAYNLMNTYFYTTSTPDSGSSQLPGPGSQEVAGSAGCPTAPRSTGSLSRFNARILPYRARDRVCRSVLFDRDDGLSPLLLFLFTVLLTERLTPLQSGVLSAPR